MLGRRSFLIGMGAIAIATGISGCSNADDRERVLLLEGSIPPQLIGDFYREIAKEKQLIFKPEPQFKNIFDLLENWQKNSEENLGLLDRIPFVGREQIGIVDLATIGDYWLQQAIAKKLIQPLNLAQLKTWQNVPSFWQNVVKRNEKGEIDPKGKIWGAPYRWGSTVIVYDRDAFKQEKFDWVPTDWQDLWREELRDRISILDQPREVIGLTLKKLGYSYNEPNLDRVKDLKSQLAALQTQIKYYSSTRYLEPLVLGDTWVAVGWSSDIFPLLSRYPNLKVVVPRSGTSIWSDVWVKPAGVKKTDQESAISQQWIDFCWQENSANQISLFTSAISPRIFSLKAEKLPQDIRDNPLFEIRQILDKCDFLEPLSEQAQKQYETFWREMRQVASL
jgi:putative spermidine/putrescine transport system substrate-binding protein